MPDTARKLMTVDEFLIWQLDHDARYELVDGVPVEMMSGASGAHDTIVTNIISALRPQLRGTPCRVASADTAIRTKIRASRRSDVLVTCDPATTDRYEALEPRLVVEVLSPSNAGVRWERKMAEYRRHPKLQYILVVDSLSVAATLYTRSGGDWETTDSDRLTDVFELTAIGCRLSMQDTYEETGLTEAGGRPESTDL